MNTLKAYDSGSSSGDSSDEEEVPKLQNEDHTIHLKKPSGSSILSKSTALVSAPVVQPNETMDDRRHLDPMTKELAYNPKFDELFAPVAGPVNPNKTQQESAVKNTLAGYVEPAHVNHFQFELERRTFRSYGYAHDPSQDNFGDKLITNKEGEEIKEEEAKTVFEAVKTRPKDKRKRERNDDPGDIEGFIGPWGKFKDEVTTAVPSEEDSKFLEEYLSKMKKRVKKTVDESPMEEKSTLHIKDAYDYQGRSFLHIPQDLGVNLKSDVPPEKCFIPKRQIHEWKGHTRGVAVIRWFPVSGHLLLSGGMDTKVKLWEVYKNRRCIRTYSGHRYVTFFFLAFFLVLQSVYKNRKKIVKLKQPKNRDKLTNFFSNLFFLFCREDCFEICLAKAKKKIIIILQFDGIICPQNVRKINDNKVFC